VTGVTGLWRPLDERLGLSELTYPVPRHANTLAYSLGGVSLIGFLLLFISGVLLAQYYVPFPQSANDSVRAMMQSTGLARFLRSVPGLLATTVGLFFTGTVLKWDQEGFEALEHNVAIGHLLGGLGHWFTQSFWANFLIFIFLLLVPFVDRSPEAPAGRRPVRLVVGLAALLGLVVLALLAWLTPGAVHVGG